jgi:hypothetical protein
MIQLYQVIVNGDAADVVCGVIRGAEASLRGSHEDRGHKEGGDEAHHEHGEHVRGAIVGTRGLQLVTCLLYLLLEKFVLGGVRVEKRKVWVFLG